MTFFNRKPKITVEISDHSYSIDILIKNHDDIVERKRLYIDDLYCYHNRMSDFAEQVRDLKKERDALKIKVKNMATSTATTSGQTSSIWHVLGTMPTTDTAQIEKAYRRMAMVYHPDHGGTSTTFQQLTMAKEKALAKCK